MKKSALIFLSLVITGICSAQENHTIPMESTSAWRLWHGMWDGTGGGLISYDGRVFVAGDTTIKNLVYTKLSNSGIRTYSYQGHNSTSHFSDPHYALIRSDSTCTYLLFDNEEVLLYDFSLQVGDTLPETFINGNTVIVSSIDTVIVNGKSLRRFNIYEPNNNSLISNWYIEGIGHEYGLIEPMFLMMDNATGFECYAEDGVAIFPEGSNCDLTVAVIKVMKPETALCIYPNPSQGLITLTYPSNTTKEVEIQIRGARGEVITSTKWTVHAGQNERNFNLNSVKPGLFVAIVLDDREISARKLFIIR